jgi:hypothetical protein
MFSLCSSGYHFTYFGFIFKVFLKLNKQTRIATCLSLNEREKYIDSLGKTIIRNKVVDSKETFRLKDWEKKLDSYKFLKLRTVGKS